ncbi:ArnT family glycosyltransferase [Cellulomonas sp. P5_C5]
MTAPTVVEQTHAVTDGERAAGPSGGRLWPTVAVCVVGLVMFALAVARSAHNLSNIDGISYISIARQYAGGHLHDAVNAYWSPLISWLAAPLISAGVGDLTAVAVVSAAAALLGTVVGAAFVWRVTRHHTVATALFAVIAVVFYAGSIPSLTPDVLVVTWTTCFAYALYRVDEALTAGRRVWLAAAVLGAVCAAGYVTKLFLVPVIVVTVAVCLALRLLVGPDGPARRRLLAATGVALLVSIVLAAPWVAAMTWKYGELTIGSSFSVNMTAKFDPAQAGGPAVVDAPLWAPPNDRAVSFGEDRTFQVGGDREKVHEPIVSRVRYYAEQRVLAMPHYLEKISSIAPWAVAIMITSTLVLLLRRGGGTLRAPLVVLNVAFWVYFLGYAGVTTAERAGGNSRYYWPLLTLSTLAACIVLPYVWDRFARSGNRWQRGVAAAVVVLLPLSALWQHGAGRGEPFSAADSTSGLSYLVEDAPPPALEVVAQDLAEIVEPGSRIVGGNYRATLRLAFYLHAQAYGRAEQGYDVADPSFVAKLDDAGIDYYLSFTPSGVAPPDLSALGTTVWSSTAPVTCSDILGAVVESCRLDLVDLNDDA